MKFSYSAVWDETVRLLRAHAPLIAAIAGVFIFLPALLIAYALPQQPVADASQTVPALVEYLSRNWLWLLLQSLINSLGTIAILTLVFGRPGTSVGAAIGSAAALLPFYFLASILVGLILSLGFLLLIVPAFYLFGRLAPLGPVIVAEDRRNPIEAIRRTFEVTRGHGWAVLGLILLVAIPGAIAMGVINVLLGIVFSLVASREIAAFLVMIATSLSAAVLTVVLILLYAAVYRALGQHSEATAATFD